MKKYQVNFRNHITGAISAIDVITAGDDYTAENYIRDCEKYADDDWNEMLSCGSVTLEIVEN